MKSAFHAIWCLVLWEPAWREAGSLNANADLDFEKLLKDSSLGIEEQVQICIFWHCLDVSRSLAAKWPRSLCGSTSMQTYIHNISTCVIHCVCCSTRDGGPKHRRWWSESTCLITRLDSDHYISASDCFLMLLSCSVLNKAFLKLYLVCRLGMVYSRQKSKARALNWHSGQVILFLSWQLPIWASVLATSSKQLLWTLFQGSDNLLRTSTEGLCWTCRVKTRLVRGCDQCGTRRLLN